MAWLYADNQRCYTQPIKKNYFLKKYRDVLKPRNLNCEVAREHCTCYQVGQRACLFHHFIVVCFFYERVFCQRAALKHWLTSAGGHWNNCLNFHENAINLQLKFFVAVMFTLHNIAVMFTLHNQSTVCDITHSQKFSKLPCSVCKKSYTKIRNHVGNIARTKSPRWWCQQQRTPKMYNISQQ